MERIFRNAEDEKRFKALEEHLDIKFRAGDGRIAVCGRASDQGKPSMIIINDLELSVPWICWEIPIKSYWDKW